MKKKNKYEELTASVIELVGGKDNISFFTHCITRLRFNIKDKGLVDHEEIKKMEGVIGTQWSGEQFQIIVGQGVVDVYEIICRENDFNENTKLDERLSGEKKKEKLNLFQYVLKAFMVISDCVFPIIPALIGCGLIKALTMLLTMGNILDPANSTSMLLSYVADAVFYFLPVFVGANAAKKFGANQSLGMLIGAMLIYPQFIAAIEAGTGLHIFGLPVYEASYAYSIFPVILCCAVMAPIEKFIARKSPTTIRAVVEPLLTLLIMVPLSFCVLAPMGAIVSNVLISGFTWLYNTAGFFAIAVVAAFESLLIATGLHYAGAIYQIQMLSTVGIDPFWTAAETIHNVNVGAASLAVSLKTKNKSIKAIGMSSSITALVSGITEPGIFGISLKYKTPLYGTIIGGLVGGSVAGILKATAYSIPGSFGLFAISSFIGPHMMNIVYMIIAIIVGMATTFIATWILYKDDITEIAQ